MLRYLAALSAILFLLWLIPFLLPRLAFYPRVTYAADFPNLEFGFRAKGQNADIVIYGDSSAKHGVNPRQIEAALHLRVVNIPGSVSLLNIADDLPLRQYIQADKPPSLIVLYFAPWSLDYHKEGITQATPVYDGMEMLYRYGSANDVLLFAEAHPTLLGRFPFMWYQVNVPAIFKGRAKIRIQTEQVASTNGYVDSAPDQHEAPNCAIPQQMIDKIGFDTAIQLAKKYETSQTKVLVYAAPIPACLNAQNVLDKFPPGAPIAPPKLLDPSFYPADKYYVHLFPQGVPASTNDLITAIRPLLQSSHP